MKKIAIFTTSRAEFGLFSNLIYEIDRDDDLEYILFVGGSHHLESQGNSIQEIRSKERQIISYDFLLSTDSEKSLTQSMGVASFQLSELFSKYLFDSVCILGDRIELLPIIQTAIIFNKPIIHIHGGEVTEGASDEQVRHMITKASHLHFTACEVYQKNVVKMGEESWRVHNVGALGIDSIVNSPGTSKENLFSLLNIDASEPTILLTYHPVTLETDISSESQLRNVFEALRRFDFQVVITAPNIDTSHESLFEIIAKQVEENPKYRFIRTLGISRYQAMLRHVEFVIGNSSSGILEAPYFKIPTINIGDRQSGRVRHKSIIDTDYSMTSIEHGINVAVGMNKKQSLQDMTYLFGDGKASERIVKVLKTTEVGQRLLRKKLVFD